MGKQAMPRKRMADCPRTPCPNRDRGFSIVLAFFRRLSIQTRPGLTVGPFQRQEGIALLFVMQSINFGIFTFASTLPRDKAAQALRTYCLFGI